MRQTIMTLTILIAAAALIAALSCPAAAAVSGVCSNCHTMHSSQTASPVAWTDKGWTPGQTPNGSLLVAGCLGCHKDPAGAGNTGSNSVPYVNHTVDPTYGATGTTGNTLAGGTFYHVSSDDSKGHNVDGIDAQDGDLLLTPPGYDKAEASTLGLPNLDTWTSQLTCAGSLGCHGDHTESNQFAALSGGHHGDDSTIDGSTVVKSYRFLLGIVGKEWNTDGATGGKWEYKPTDTQHNQYKGEDRADDVYGSDTTISYLCAECHGFFHSSDNAGDTDTGGIDDGTWGTWVRHPTDYDMGNTDGGSEYEDYNSDGETYSVIAPVASANVSAVISDVTFSDDTIVTCISCHRAHGTDFSDMLRWDYSGIDAGSGASNDGCFICHTTKDT